MKLHTFLALVVMVGLSSCSDDNPVQNDPATTVQYGSKTYHAIQIGTQTWLRENLDIGTIITGNQNAANNDTIEKYCYDDNPANCSTDGGLYLWNEAMQYSTFSTTTRNQ